MAANNAIFYQKMLCISAVCLKIYLKINYLFVPIYNTTGESSFWNNVHKGLKSSTIFECVKVKTNCTDWRTSGSNQYQIMCTIQSFVCTCSAASGLSGSEGAQNKDQHRICVYSLGQHAGLRKLVRATRGAPLRTQILVLGSEREHGCVYWDSSPAQRQHLILTGIIPFV